MLQRQNYVPKPTRESDICFVPNDSMMTGEVLLGGDEPDSLPLRGLPSGLRYQSPHFPRAVGHSWQARRPF